MIQYRWNRLLGFIGYTFYLLLLQRFSLYHCGNLLRYLLFPVCCRALFEILKSIMDNNYFIDSALTLTLVHLIWLMHFLYAFLVHGAIVFHTHVQYSKIF